jgi:hypothetical protein
VPKDDDANTDRDADRIQEGEHQSCIVVEIVPASRAELTEVRSDMGSGIVDVEAVKYGKEIRTGGRCERSRSVRQLATTKWLRQIVDLDSRYTRKIIRNAQPMQFCRASASLTARLSIRLRT